MPLAPRALRPETVESVSPKSSSAQAVSSPTRPLPRAALAAVMALFFAAPAAAQQVIQITATNDDVYERNQGIFNGPTGCSGSPCAIRISTDISGGRHGGLRFPGVAAARGAIVTSATLEVYISGTNDDLVATVAGHATSNAPDFVAQPSVSRRVPTRSSVSVNQPNWGTGWKSIDVTSLVQELVNQPAWSSGNAVALLIFGKFTSSGNCDFDSVDTAPANAPRLTINTSGVATAILMEHPAGQLQNELGFAATQNDVRLLRFSLLNNTGAAVTVNQIVFPLSAVSGIASGDLSDLRIRDGVSDWTTGGVASIAGATGTITFSGSWALPVGYRVDYTLQGDVANLAAGDSLTLSLAAGDITLASGTVGGLAPLDATHALPGISSLVGYSDYAASGVRPLQYSTYAATWAAPGATAVPGPFTTDSASRWALHWKVARTSSRLDRQAVVFQENDQSFRDHIWASLWDGTNWDDGTGAPFADAWDSGRTHSTPFRNFDAAYEDESGRLVIVAGINTDESVKWWRHDGATTWQAVPLYETVANNIQDPSNVFEWIRLAPMPGTNKIAFIGIANDVSNVDSAAIEAMIWDGDLGVWHSKYILNFPSSQSYHSTDAADIHFVLGGENVGEALAVWASGELVRSSLWNPRTGWTAVAQVLDLGVGNDVKWLRLEAEPEGRGMVLALEDVNGRIGTLAYDGRAGPGAPCPGSPPPPTATPSTTGPSTSPGTWRAARATSCSPTPTRRASTTPAPRTGASTTPAR